MMGRIPSSCLSLSRRLGNPLILHLNFRTYRRVPLRYTVVMGE